MDRDQLVFGIILLVLGVLYILMSIYGEYDRDHQNAIKNLFRKDTPAIRTPKWWRRNTFIAGLAILVYGAARFWEYRYGHLSKSAEVLTQLVFFAGFVLFIGQNYYQKKGDWKKILAGVLVALVTGVGIAGAIIYLVTKHVIVGWFSMALVPITITIIYFIAKHFIEKHAHH
jgi:hypothetical protein